MYQLSHRWKLNPAYIYISYIWLVQVRANVYELATQSKLGPLPKLKQDRSGVCLMSTWCKLDPLCLSSSWPSLGLVCISCLSHLACTRCSAGKVRSGMYHLSSWCFGHALVFWMEQVSSREYQIS